MTADLCDAFPDRVQVAEPVFRSFGGLATFYGPVETLKVFEDNTLVRETLETEGRGRVLVVDGGASTRCALVGGNLAGLAHIHGWAGVVVYGGIRDTVGIAAIPVGVLALHTVPRKSEKRSTGERGVPVRFAGVTFLPGHYLYADPDGVITAVENLLVL